MARSKGTTRQKKTKKVGPKKALSAFMFFSKKKRQEILDEQPKLRNSVIEVSKLIGAAWRELEESEKTPFAEEADKDKLRYAKEKQEYDHKIAEEGSGAAQSNQKGGRKSPASRKPAQKRKKKEESEDEEDEEVNSDDIADEDAEEAVEVEPPKKGGVQQKTDAKNLKAQEEEDEDEEEEEEEGYAPS